jgi:hypothetical protein
MTRMGGYDRSDSITALAARDLAGGRCTAAVLGTVSIKDVHSHCETVVQCSHNVLHMCTSSDEHSLLLGVSGVVLPDASPQTNNSLWPLS